MNTMPLRVFIVEDEVFVALEMADNVKELGFDVVGPSVHLENARDRALSDDIDVALLDINLGQGKTSEAVSDILKQRHIPFAYVTGYEREQIDFIDDSDQVVRKPVTKVQILATLRSVLGDRLVSSQR